VLVELLKIGGITGLVIGAFYLLYRQIIALPIFQRIGRTQTFVLLVLLAMLIWSLAIVRLTGLSFAEMGEKSNVLKIDGNGNAVEQDVSH
jgi:nitrate reductase gamma subunit